jgi:predicted transcriptional regulator
VFCPVRERSTDPGLCAACPHLLAIRKEAVECAPPRVAQSTIGSYGGARLLCLHEDLHLAAIDAFASPGWVFPVVDEQTRFVGLAADSQRATLDLPPGLVMARHLGLRSALVLHESQPVGQALRAMAQRRARFVTLLDDEGTPRALLTDVEVLRALPGAKLS